VSEDEYEKLMARRESERARYRDKKSKGDKPEVLSDEAKYLIYEYKNWSKNLEYLGESRIPREI